MWTGTSDFEIARIDKWLDADRIDAHINAAFDRTPLELDPYPHIVIENWLPDDVYARIIDAMPASVFFATRSRRTLGSSVRRRAALLAPGMGVCRKYDCRRMVYRALNRKFQDVICRYVRSFVPSLPQDIDLTLHPSDGRIMLRRPGYNLDAASATRNGASSPASSTWRAKATTKRTARRFIACVMIRGADQPRLLPEPGNCELVKDVPFRANSMLVFLNSEGAHGARFRPTAADDLERYIYQFRLGPAGKVIKRLIRLMPPEQAAMWAGAKTARAAAISPPSIAIVVTFFGKAPFWMPAFLLSCRANPDVQWIIYTDIDVAGPVPAQHHLQPMTVADLNQRCSQRLGTTHRHSSAASSAI